MLKQKIGGDFIAFEITPVQKEGLKATSYFIHGQSFAVEFSDVQFLTWRMNDETGLYWLNLHINSHKEIRIKVDLNQLNDILSTWAKCKYGTADVLSLPYFNGDTNVVDYKQ